MNTKIFLRFLAGITIAYKSLQLLYKNKRLYLFFILPVILILTEKILVKIKYLPTNSLSIIKKFGEFYTTSHNGFTCIKIYNNWLYVMAGFCIFIFIAITTLSVILVTKITNNIQKKEDYKITKFINIFISKINSWLAWAVISFIFIYGPTIIFSIYKTEPKISYVVNSLISLGFLFATSFVIQAIALDNLGIYKALKKSIKTIYNVFFEYLGIMFFISIISGIFWFIFQTLTVFLFASGVVPNGKVGFYEIILYGIFTIIAAIEAQIIIFMYDISKTLLYNNFESKE